MFGYSVRGSLNQVLDITRGDHSRVHQALLREAVERLSNAGVKVLIAEAPLHPAAAELYDTSLRTEFLDFAQSPGRNGRGPVCFRWKRVGPTRPRTSPI